MRKKFCKSLEIDAGRRAAIAQDIEQHASLSQEAGEEVMARFQELFKERHGYGRPSRSFGLDDSKVHAELVGGHAWGSASIAVKAKSEEVRRHSKERSDFDDKV